MAETVKWHKIQRVAELVQSALLNKIHQKPKLGQNVNATKQMKTVKLKKTGQTGWIDLFCHWITLFLGLSH